MRQMRLLRTGLTAVLGTTDISGWWSIMFPLDDRIKSADLHWQFVQFDNGTLRASQRLRTDIR